MKRLTTIIVSTLIIAEIVLSLLSWLLSAMMTDGVRSLLSAEGLRWLLGGFADIIASPPLAWLLLIAMAVGCIHGSRLPQGLYSLKTPRKTPGAIWLTLVCLILLTVSGALLVAMPHAPLLSATGSVWPSPFSHALIPLLALDTITLAVVYGFVAQTFTSAYDVIKALAQGIEKAAPLFIIYVLAAQFIASLMFVISGTFIFEKS